MSAGTEGQEQKSPLREIIQPFIDLLHAPRALWGINLAYVLEGMVYFGMLGYLAIYCSEYIFQAIDGADEAAHYMVMVLTAGITIAMFFLGVVADKRGVRFALIAAFILMLIGRFIWAAGPTLFGQEPVRPNVVAGDRISLHVTGLDTRRGNKTITKAVVIANNPGSVDVDATLKLDLAAGEGTALGEALESRLVRLGEVRLVEGEGQEWKGLYGSEGITAKLFIRGAKDLHLRPGATISLDHAYVALNKEDAKNKRSGPRPVLEAGAKLALSHAQIVKKDKDSDEFVINVQWPDGVFGCTDPDDHLIIRSHWVSDVAAVNTFPMDLAAGEGIEPNAELDNRHVRISAMTLVAGEGDSWEVTYGDKPVKARVVFKGRAVGMIGEGFPPDLADGAGRVPDEQLVGQPVRIGRAVLLGDHQSGWELQYGSAGLRVPLHIRSKGTVALRSGAAVALRQAQVMNRGEAGLGLRARWPDDFVAIDTYGCEVSPYRELVTRDERDLKVTSSVALAEPEQMPAGAQPVTIAELREMADGRVNVVLRGVSVTYVRNGGYLLQADKDGPAIAVFVSPFWSPLQIVTMVGILVVVLGYGMYQPAAYAGVRKFTTPKTAAMGFAMLYALMNLGGWLPSFAFLARDDDYLGLGIRGTFWIYVGFTLLALVCTALILSRRTVATAEATAKAETARIKAEANAGKQEAESSGKKSDVSAAEDGAARRVKPHMWLFWVGAIALFLFKGESPWYYTWTELMQSWSRDGFLSLVVWRWLIAGAVFVLPLVVAAVPRVRNWIARHPLQDAKFAYFIFALIPVQTLFTYNWLVLPAYIKRAYEGWLGQYFEIAANANPILIFIAVPIITAITQKAKVYNMMIYGTFVMAAPAFLLVLGPHWWALLAYILIMTIGEAMWQPRFLQYAAEIAPEGRTGEYMGVAQLPWFLTKVLVPILYSGRMMDRFCPAVGPKNTEMMWFIFACIAMLSTVLLILAKGWIGRDFKTRAD
jgi:MFS family permease